MRPNALIAAVSLALLISGSARPAPSASAAGADVNEQARQIEQRAHEVLDEHRLDKCLRFDSPEQERDFRADQAQTRKFVSEALARKTANGNAAADGVLGLLIALRERMSDKDCMRTSQASEPGNPGGAQAERSGSPGPALGKWHIVKIDPLPPGTSGFQYKRREDTAAPGGAQVNAESSAAEEQFRHETEEMTKYLTSPPPSLQAALDAGFKRTAIEQGIDRIFGEWSEEWLLDRYQSGSAHIDKMDRSPEGYRAEGSFSVFRGAQSLRIGFVAAIVDFGNGDGEVRTLCYIDKTVPEEQCM